MTFSSTVKSEVSKREKPEAENISELSAIIRNSYYNNNEIKIMTENASIARRCFKMLKDIYGIFPQITVRKGYNYNKNLQYILSITKKVKIILQDLSIDSNIPKEYIISDEYLIRAYLRGLFLIVGSVNDPKKSRYHLEFLVNDNDYAEFIIHLLNNFNLNSKVLKRENKYMVYIKEAEKIGDFLRIIDASAAVLYYEDIRIYRDHKNMTNRLNNCEQANIDKIVMTGNKQAKDIEKIINTGGLDLLDEKEQTVAVYRSKYPEASLLELSEIITIETGHKISKSGVYHRMKKIIALAQKID